MDNFDLKKYLAEGKLFEQERYRKVTDDDQGLDGVFYVEEDGYFVDLDYGKYKSATKELLDLAMEQGHEYESVENYYTYADNFENELKDYAEGEEVPDWQMNDLAVEYGTDYSQFYGEEEDEDDDEDVYENTIKEDKLVWTIEGDDDSPTIESSDKGYKEAVVSYIKSIHPNISDKNLKKSMEVAEETWYNEGRENAKSGEGEDFDVSVEEFADGAVEYYEDAYLEEGVTADEIASRVRKLGKEKGIEDEYIEDYIDELDGNFEPDAYENSTDKDLLDDLKSYIDLSEGVIKENITKLDDYALEIYSDFKKDPSIHFPDVEFEVDEEGFALENDSNYSQLKKYKREIMGLHALFGEESGVKDKNGLQLSMDGVIDNI
jgi:hypothetical protein